MTGPTSTDDRQRTRLVVHDPTGVPPVVTGKHLADRGPSLEGRPVFLVDSRFDDSGELLRQVDAWFGEHLPTVRTTPVQLSGTYATDDPQLWERIAGEGGVAILGVGHCSTCAPAVTTHAITLETRYGVPAVAVHTETFHRVVGSVARMGGLADLTQVFVPQPVMGRSAAQLRDYVDGTDPVHGGPVMQRIVDGLTAAGGGAGGTGTGSGTVRTGRRRLLAAASEERLHELFLERAWTDQLPVVLPTEARVAAMLRGTSRDPGEVVGRMQPTANRGAWSYTVEMVAVNAVMAGCRPEYLPVVLALTASGRSARGSSSSSAAVTVVVNGPVRDEIGMNSGIGAMGPYNHANATIGRAYGLASQNLQGGSVPGETYMGSQGNALTYSNVTFAENEERSPWEPLHVQRGHRAEESTVTVFQGGRSTTFGLGLRAQHWREHVQDMLRGTDVVGAPMLLLDPIAAEQFVERGGFADKAALISWIHDTATMRADRYWDLQLVRNYIEPRAGSGEEPLAGRLTAAPEEEIPMFLERDVNVVVVGGGTNGYWQIMGSRPVATVSVDEWR
ncbi:UGSC family (seleno)protein [Pseudonocardia sp. NPDC046786]|uniref:UGSC family (seleno)protein n=1 Tax=Pseudonocardia sp. NPDC046786 TaxID=3155471 RepID=UPI0033ECE067